MAIIWKNGKIYQKLTDGTQDAYANSIYITNGDIYIAGWEGRIAKMWKNGQATHLTKGKHLAFATSVYVYNNDVYVTGYEFIAGMSSYDGQTIAKVWKNGKLHHNLTNGSNYAEANSIYVIDNDIYIAGYS